MATIQGQWQTVATVGYTGGVGRNENRAAHGGVCHLQARMTKHGLRGRKVNANGRHVEEGESFPLDAGMLAHWRRIATA